jgi:hypothetical protein
MNISQHYRCSRQDSNPAPLECKPRELSLDHYMGFEVLIAINIQIAAFCDVTPCSLVHSVLSGSGAHSVSYSTDGCYLGGKAAGA